MRPRFAIPAVLALLVTGGATTAPATRPATAPVAIDPAIQRQVDRLADPDPAVRDGAVEQLMGLPADALPRLLAVVRAAHPLLPAQAAALHEVVRQVVLADDPYAAVTDADDAQHVQPRLVMGLRWSDTGVEARLGVPVTDRWPGFPARRVLRDGDLILGIYFERQHPLRQWPNVTTHQFTVMRAAIMEHPAVRDIDLSVLRDGREVRLSMTLVPQAGPAVLSPDAFLDDRSRRAEKYWQDTFAPTVDPVADPPDGAASPVDR